MVVGDQCVLKPLERHSNSPLPYFQFRKVPSSTTVRLFGAKLLRWRAWWGRGARAREQQIVGEGRAAGGLS